MLRQDYDIIDYVSILQKTGVDLSIPFENNVLPVPAKFGSGYMMAFNSPEGFSVLLMNCSFNQGMLSKRYGNPSSQTFIFSVNETVELEKNYSRERPGDQQVFLLKNNAAHFFGSWLDSSFYFPPGVIVRSANIMMDNDYIKKTLGPSIYEKFSNFYYSHSKVDQPEAIVDAEYRKILSEIIDLNSIQPLRLHFIHNRIMLMVEKFVGHTFEKMKTEGSRVILKDDEIRRLIMVESLLVKDYTTSPPTIADLSKVAAMSATKLKADFKILYGLPIYEYYQKHRMLFAKSLLLQAEYSVKEVGRMVGYSNLGHFAASFKKAFNILPKSLHSSEQPDLLQQNDDLPDFS